MPEFTFSQKARMAAMRLNAQVQARTRDPQFRTYGRAFICAAMVISALAGREGQKAEWARMNSDSSTYVGPWSTEQQQQQLQGGGSTYTDANGRTVPIQSSSPGRSW